MAAMAGVSCDDEAASACVAGAGSGAVAASGWLSGSRRNGVCYRRCRWRHGGYGGRSGPDRRFRCWCGRGWLLRLGHAALRHRSRGGGRRFNALAIITPGRRRLRRPSGALRRAGLKATIEGLRRRNRDGSGIAGDELQRCGDGRQAHERFVVDAEGGEHAESAAQRHDRGNHRRDHQADIRKHSTSPNPRAIRSSTHHKRREIIARAYCVRAGRGPAPDASPDRRRFDRRIQHLRRLRESLKNQQEKFAGRPRC